MYEKNSTFLTAMVLYLSLSKHVNAAQTYNVNTLSNINIRIDGAASGDKTGDYNLFAADLNNNGIVDAVITTKSAAYSGRTVAMTYIVYDSILSTLTGSGNTLDLSNSAKWNIRYVGAVTGDTATYYSTTASDLDNNGKNDLVLAHYAADHGGTSNRGAVYVIKDELIDDYSGTGNTVDLSTTTNFSIKYLGAAASDNFGTSIGAMQDFDNDGKKDLLVAASNADFNSRSNSGSVYLIYNSLIDDYSGTGNVVAMDTSTNYNIRVDAAVAGDYLVSYLAPGTGDIDNDSKDDLFVAAPYTDYGDTDAGSMYLIYNTILDDYSSTGNTIDLSSATKYNVRID